MSYLASTAFWTGALERAVKTFAQAFLATLIASEVVGVLDVDWKQSVGVAALATLMSVLTSVASGPISPGGSASVVDDRPAYGSIRGR